LLQRKEAGCRASGRCRRLEPFAKSLDLAQLNGQQTSQAGNPNPKVESVAQQVGLEGLGTGSVIQHASTPRPDA
jgi:hypothetical protein